MLRKAIALILSVLSLWSLGVPGGVADSPAKPRILLGAVPARNVIATLKEYQPIVDYLNRRLGLDIELGPQKDYLSVLQKMGDGSIDAGILGSFTCYRAIKELGARPLARPERTGVSTYEGLVFARRDSGIASLDELQGKTFIYVDPYTSAGYIFPRALLKARGTSDAAFFGRRIFAGKHDAAVLMVLDRKGDAGAAKDDIYRRLAAKNPRIARELRVLYASTARFPDRTLAVRKGFDAGLAQAIRAALLGMDQNATGRRALAAAGFDRYIATDLESFGTLEAMLQ